MSSQIMRFPDGSMEGPVAVPAASFICPPGHHRPITTPLERFCVDCGLSVDLQPVWGERDRHPARLDVEGGGLSGTDWTTRDGLYAKLHELAALRDGRGRLLSHSSRYKFRYLEWRSNRTSTKKDPARGTAAIAYDLVMGVTRSLGLHPLVASDANRLLRHAAEHNLLSKFSIEDRVAGAVYVILSRPQWDIAVPTPRIIEAAGAGKRGSFEAAKAMRAYFHISQAPVSLLSHLRYHALPLLLSPEERLLCEEVLKVPDIDKGTSAPPRSIVAGVVYLVRNWGPRATEISLARSRESIAKATGTTTVTIRNMKSSLLDWQRHPERAEAIGEILRRGGRR